MENNNINTDICENLTAANKSSAFSDLYKPIVTIDQNKRREQLLAEQKRRRNEILDDARGIQLYDPSNFVKHKKKYYAEYKNKIMLSEWLVEVAPDFDVSWFMKICPDGHRNLVVVHKNSTKSYSKTGRFECKFNSVFPGGFTECNNYSNKYKTTILDCIWNQKSSCFYILDVLIWADYDLTEYDAEFRFFWLQSKLAELPEIEIVSSNNDYSFYYAKHFACDYPSLTDILVQYPFYEDKCSTVDGLLFYHKEASYTGGRTPLVGWLKPYMVPEILKISVAEQYLSLRPQNYSNLQEYLAIKRKKKAAKKLQTKMETI